MSNNNILYNFINGKFKQSNGNKTYTIKNPSTNEYLAEVPISTYTDVNNAVNAAKTAFNTWSNTPITERIQYLFKIKHILNENIHNIARHISIENGKTIQESILSIQRGIENIDHAIGATSLIMGKNIANIAYQINTYTMRQSIGVFAAITPYNFPAMIAFWFWPYAIAFGNTFILKPSEQVSTTQNLIFQLIQSANLPQGVLNLIHGDKITVKHLIKHPDINGISFVGSSQTAKVIYNESIKNNKKIQAFGGGNNYAIIMPDANKEKSISNIISSAFGCAGQRCLAISQLIMIDSAYDKYIDYLIQKTKRLNIGNSLNKNTDLGPIISEIHKNNICKHIEDGIKEGAKILLDGRNIYNNKFKTNNFLGPTILDNINPNMKITKNEIFGPVLNIIKLQNLDQAINIINNCKFANATTIFTSNGYTARKFENKVNIEMIGINIGIAAPMALFPFGGSKQSFFGDIKTNGDQAINFFTKNKIITSRWF